MNEPAITPESKFSESFAADYVQQTRVHLNFAQNVVIITEDRLELCLRKHLACIEARTRWIAPASLFIAFLTTLCTSTFHDSFNLKADVWQAIFVLLTVASFVWLVFAVVQAFRFKSSLRNLLQEIKQSANISSNQQ
jgi:hypothetical protein